MGYLSCDASVKVSKNGSWHSTKTNKNGNQKKGNGGVKGYVHHVARDVEKAEGIETGHSNENINSELTDNNETWYKDDFGSWQRCTKSTQLEDAVNRRIAYVEKNRNTPLRDDTVVLRPILTQLDCDDMDDDEMNELIEHQAVFLEKAFGADNVVGFSVHRDETNLHIHWLVTPVTEETERECLSKEPILDADGNQKRRKDGRLVWRRTYGAAVGTGNLTFSQKGFSYFRTSAGMSQMHKDFRNYLIQAGYDVALENKPIEEYSYIYTDGAGNVRRKGMTPQALKEVTDIEDSAYEVRNKYHAAMVDLNVQRKAIAKERAAVKALQADLEAEREMLRQNAEKARVAQMAALQAKENYEAEADRLNVVYEQKLEVALEGVSVDQLHRNVTDVLKKSVYRGKDGSTMNAYRKVQQLNQIGKQRAKDKYRDFGSAETDREHGSDFDFGL